MKDEYKKAIFKNYLIEQTKYAYYWVKDKWDEYLPKGCVEMAITNLTTGEKSRVDMNLIGQETDYFDEDDKYPELELNWFEWENEQFADSGEMDELENYLYEDFTAPNSLIFPMIISTSESDSP